MKFILIILMILLLSNCSKQQTVLICGDHVCINKKEAVQYFEENLSIEVKIVDKKVKKELNLVQLNLKENRKGKREIKISSKASTDKDLKTLSNREITEIKENINNKKREKNIAKKVIKKNNEKKEEVKAKKVIKEETVKQKKNQISQNNTYKKQKDVVDVCTILEKCSIDEISKYLLEQGNKKDYPDITTRQ
jgi:hypothetical protein